MRVVVLSGLALVLLSVSVDMKTLASAASGNKAKKKKKTASKPPPGRIPGEVYDIRQSSHFKTVVFETDKMVLVKFHKSAEHVGGKFKSSYSKLAQNYRENKNIIVASVNCEILEGICKKWVKDEMYPSFFLWRGYGGSKQRMDANGKPNRIRWKYKEREAKDPKDIPPDDPKHELDQISVFMEKWIGRDVEYKERELLEEAATGPAEKGGAASDASGKGDL